MKKTERLYPFGFIFKVKYIDDRNIPEHYQKESISNIYDYHYDEIIEPIIYEENNSFLIIHGHFKHVGINNSYNQQELTKELFRSYYQNYEQFLDLLDFIGGRFVIIIGDESKVNIFHDAAGTRTVYYSLDSKIVSSHVHFINDVLEHDKNLSIQKYNHLVYSFDNSPYINIKSLVPNFQLDFHQQKVHRYFPRSHNRYIDLSSQEKVKIVSKLWSKQIEYYTNHYTNIAFSLTGGNDSRVSLAMVKPFLDKIKFFTYTTKENDQEFGNFRSRILNLDQYIVKQIVSDIKLNHKFFYLDNSTRPLSNVENKIMNKNTLKIHGRNIIPFYNDLFPENYVLHIRANLLEIGSASYMFIDTPNTVDSIEQKFKGYIGKSINNIPSDIFKTTLQDGIKALKYDDNFYDYHLVDMYYWEDRMGRWYSEVLNETDSAFDSINPFNMRAIIEISLSFDYKDKKSNKLFSELINLNFSILNFYGKNNLKNLYEQVSEKNVIINSDYEREELFSHFVCQDNESKSKNTLTTYDNSLFIPKEHCTHDSFSEVNFTYNKTEGIVKLSLISLYNNPKGLNYLQYEVYINGRLLLIEDMSKWNLETDINIMNVRKNYQIKIIVRCLKNIKSDSMKLASTLYITDYQEISSDKITPHSITTTSPYSQLMS